MAVKRSMISLLSPRGLARVCAATALLALPACGDDSSADDDGHTHPDECEAADTFTRNVSKTGPNGVTVSITDAVPAVPGINIDNTWTVSVTDSSGNALEGASLSMEQRMPPPHDHGTDRKAQSSEMGGGVYELAPVDFSMDGSWKVPIAVTKDSLSDQAAFEFCIGG
ncbi:MAG TPA: FixH family protein [Polyangiaceae bacterium]|nr:FixH family protein [Polyangiaceae bacterium]